MGEFSLVRPFGPPIGLFPMPLDLVLALNSWADERLDLEVLAAIDFSSQLAGEVFSELKIPDDVARATGLFDYLKRCVAGYIRSAVGREITGVLSGEKLVASRLLIAGLFDSLPAITTLLIGMTVTFPEQDGL